MKTKLLFAFLFSLCILQPNVSSAQVIAAGGSHSLSVCSDNTVLGWGNNSSGQLGDRTNGNARTTPVPVYSLTGITAVAGGGNHSIFLKNDGTVWACGLNV